MNKALATVLAVSSLLGACDDDEAPGSELDAGSDASIDASADAGVDASDARVLDAARTFTVTLENVAATKAFTSSGVFNTPLGDSAPGPATPGKKYQFRLEAGRKQKLSFATMLAATNDLFFAPNGSGIALYDADGVPFTGDVTNQVQLWDLGTEINEEPGVGPNTVTKQPAANTGPDERGNVVEIKDATDGVAFTYPAVAEVLKVSVAYVSGTTFEITIENVSSPSGALHTSLGDRVAPISPGVWVVNNGVDPLFTVGSPDRGKGLESIAEDGNPSTLGAFVAGTSGITFPASPGVWVVHSEGSKPLFSEGQADYGKGVEAIAEDGNPSVLGSNLGTQTGAVFNTPVGASAPGPILPGSKYQFSFSAQPGTSLSLVTMLAATNDVFFAPKDVGIPLFNTSGTPVSGDITTQLLLWDDGSEVNEQPGIGPNTVTNQKAPNTSIDERGTVRLLSSVNDGFRYPAVSDVLKVTISAN